MCVSVFVCGVCVGIVCDGVCVGWDKSGCNTSVRVPSRSVSVFPAQQGRKTLRTVCVCACDCECVSVRVRVRVG